MDYLTEYEYLVESINDTILELTYDILCEDTNVSMESKGSKIWNLIVKIIHMLARAWKNMANFIKTLLKNALSKLANLKNKKCYVKDDVEVDNVIITGLPVTLSTKINSLLNILSKISSIKEITNETFNVIEECKKAIDDVTTINTISLKTGRELNANVIKYNAERYKNESDRIYEKINIINDKINDIEKFDGELSNDHIKVIRDVNNILNKYASYLSERSKAIADFINNHVTYDEEEIVTEINNKSVKYDEDNGIYEVDYDSKTIYREKDKKSSKKS